MINWKWPASHCQPIGLDIGSSAIKMIQLAINGEQVRVIAADKVRIDAEVNKEVQLRRNFIISSIKRMLAENNFHGRNVVSNLANDNVKITSLRLAEEQEDKIEQALRKEAAVRFGLEPGRDMVDYVVAGTVQQGDEIKKELIMFAAADEAIREHIKMLEDAKLRPVGIDAVACALFRSSGRLLRRHQDKEQTIVLVDIGNKHTTVVFGRNGEINFVKQIPVGIVKFSEEIASRLGVSVKDAEMLRGTLRTNQINMNQAMLGMSCALSSKAAASDTGEFSLQCESALDTETQTSAVMQQEQNNTDSDAATRHIMIDAISSVTGELCREIALCFRYYTVTFRGNRVERVIVTGGGAYEEILTNTLRKQSDSEVEIGQPLRGFDMGDARFDGCNRSLLCEWAVAAGLSMKGYQPAYCTKDGQMQHTGKRAFDN